MFEPAKHTMGHPRASGRWVNVAPGTSETWSARAIRLWARPHGDGPGHYSHPRAAIRRGILEGPGHV